MKNVKEFLNCHADASTVPVQLDQLVRDANEAILSTIINLKRFNDIDFIISNYGDEISFSDLEYLKEKSNDFFFTWDSSSTELISAVGVDVVLRLFRAFKRFEYFTWSFESKRLFNSYAYGRSHITVYRGGNPSTVDVSLSWAKRKDMANAYASVVPSNVVVTGDVSVSDILYGGDGEDEIVVEPGSVSVVSVEPTW
ncbi:hypothetical protein [Paramagnetospirillum magneticum]|uniref:hypothetical protein n=1 Tax=Paramagnetospirillum magneticum TaxID=84159 RepID=UPI0013051030|nr:hypothetical protein [Paramagnetospirillum magneticum]